jgi:outer membrane protein assembly factor BamD (BamD/ComL family)
MKRLLLLGFLLTVALGCQSLSPRGGSAQAGSPPGDSGVRQASALEPIGASDGLAAGGAVLPSADAPGKGDEEEPGFEWSDLYPSNVYKNVKAMAGYGPDESIARSLYTEGEALYEEKKYDEAAKKFASAAGRWPDSSVEEDALFMLGESQFFADKYPEAKTSYEKLLTKYDYTRRLDTVTKRLFAIGQYWEKLDAAGRTSPVLVNLTDPSQPAFDTGGHALKAYEAIQKHDPTGPLADDSVMATANAHFLKGRFEEAAYNYDLLRKEFPKSDHQLEAHQLGMESRLLMYQGSMYDGGPLETAGDIADQTLSQFATELNRDRDRIVQAKNRVVEERAERDWAMARYYDQKKYYGAARYYYAAIVDDYPHTAAAEKARARWSEIKDLPTEPPKRYGWLTGMFEREDP